MMGAGDEGDDDGGCDYNDDVGNGSPLGPIVKHDDDDNDVGVAI